MSKGNTLRKLENVQKIEVRFDGGASTIEGWKWKNRTGFKLRFRSGYGIWSTAAGQTATCFICTKTGTATTAPDSATAISATFDCSGTAETEVAITPSTAPTVEPNGWVGFAAGTVTSLANAGFVLTFDVVMQ